jgi:D-alanyl-D-alanine-carboxypeptidase/D-alanyl-D-alanine-endopeptidase
MPVYRLALVTMGIFLFSASSRADDRFLEETAEFAGTVLFLQTHVPALVLGVVRDGKTAVFGFGKIDDGSNNAPDRHTLLRVGSLAKAFTGQVLAGLAPLGQMTSTRASAL